MFLYNLSLNPQTTINNAVLGNFSGTKTQEIITSHNTRIELLRPDPNSGHIHSVLSHEVFGKVRTLAPFRLTGGSKDYIIIGSDSGRIVILEYNPTKNIFEKVHQETYGKSGVRRIVPGQYLAVDPKGRAVMVAAVEKQKLVYILNRDTLNPLTISSPLEAHKTHTICFSCVGLDVGFENPVFACLELEYEDELDADENAMDDESGVGEKVLTYYELDLGLNHVVRKWSEPVDRRANYLVAVPGGTDGPSGVLVCSENYITYRHQDAPEHRLPVPRRLDPLSNSGDDNEDVDVYAGMDGDVDMDGNRRKGTQMKTGKGREGGLLIVSSVLHKMKTKNAKGQPEFFFLLQSELGDLYKVTMDWEGDTVDSIQIKYFDTVPVASAMCILRTGYLFVASEVGNHYLFLFEHLGDADEDTEFSSADFVDHHLESNSAIYFRPRPLHNLAVADEIESMCPLIDAKVANLSPDEDTPQIFTLCGRGGRSTFRILKYGLEVSEMAVSELPGVPGAVWTTKLTNRDDFDAYIIVSFSNATLILSIGDTVEEVTDTGFLTSTPTLQVQQLGDDGLLQVYPHGIRHIRADKRVNEWKVPAGKNITAAATNHRQVVVVIGGREVVYFELDQTGGLSEFERRVEVDDDARVTCVALPEVEAGRVRAPYLAVGSDDNTVRMISLEPDTCLEQLGVNATSSPPSSLTLTRMIDATTSPNHPTLFLHIGHTNGLLTRLTVDTANGSLADSRTRFLGSRSVRLHTVRMHGNPAVLALTTRPWLAYSYQSRIQVAPLSYEMLEYASGFSSEQCEEGVVAVAGSTLRIMSVEKLGTSFNQTPIPLKYTPRRFVLHPESKNFVVVESDHCVSSPAEIQKKIKEKKSKGCEVDTDLVELPVETFGLTKSEPGMWGSCIRVLSPFQGETLHLIDLQDNEAAFSVNIVLFHNSEEAKEPLLVVGTGKDVTLLPRSCSGGFLHVYRFVENGSKLELMHKTPVDDIPLAIIPFQGRLLAGVGKALRIYDLGKRKLLRKCENKSLPNCITQLYTQGSRIVVGDIQESFHYASYMNSENRIVVFADDTTPRWITAGTMVDYDTVAGGDKFGNFFVTRLPKDISEKVDEDPTGNRIANERGYLHGAAHKLQCVAHYHLGDMPTSITKSILVPGGREVLLYTTLLGGVGMFVPFITKEDMDFFQNLEMHMRSEMPPLAGRDHLAYRGYYVPVKSTIDGDLCEQFNLLPPEKKRMIAEELERTPVEISKKIEDMRIRVAF